MSDIGSAARLEQVRDRLLTITEGLRDENLSDADAAKLAAEAAQLTDEAAQVAAKAVESLEQK